MAIETLEDIIEELANELSIYGAHSEHSADCECRVCFTSQLRRRIDDAVEIERKLSA